MKQQGRSFHRLWKQTLLFSPRSTGKWLEQRFISRGIALSTDQLKLRTTLTRIGHAEVKLLPDQRKISARSALLMAHSGDYEWGGSLHRIRWIKAMKPTPTWEPSYRNTEAPVLQQSIEWVRSVSVIGGRS